MRSGSGFHMGSPLDPRWYWVLVPMPTEHPEAARRHSNDKIDFGLVFMACSIPLIYWGMTGLISDFSIVVFARRCKLKRWTTWTVWVDLLMSKCECYHQWLRLDGVADLGKSLSQLASSTCSFLFSFVTGFVFASHENPLAISQRGLRFKNGSGLIAISQKVVEKLTDF